MKTVTITISMLLALFCINEAVSQISLNVNEQFNLSIEKLEQQKDNIENLEKDKLKKEVRAINKRLEEGEISATKAAELKKQAAEKRALNIENQLTIIDENIALLERNQEEITEDDEDYYTNMEYMKIEKVVVYDSVPRRTTSGITMAAGFNNAIIDGQSLDYSPYKIGGSRFFEIGYEFETVLVESGFVRFRYGISFQFNGLKADDNKYFVDNGDETILEEFPHSVDKAKLRMDNLVIPLYLEFGGTEICYKKDDSYYWKPDKVKFGLGGYAGVNLNTIQKLKYTENGDDKKVKFSENYNTRNIIYGLSAYIGYDMWSLYAKYDLNTIFKDNPIDQRNVAVGVRFSK
ncbi:hypothetical protein [Mesonia aquimarina]|uniref:hypothetical protein n=1 Tax=Mesonia aquimarina TaxID=1504967 RepID=UPI000EF5B9E3|nr:hypothetical protein [Mesonia aquimarina]